MANRADISQEEGAASTIADAVENFGRIDAVVNNAGIVITGALSDLTTADLRQALDVHVVGPFNVCRSAWAHMERRRYGRIVNVGSIAGTLFGVPGHSVYDAAKGALAGFTRSLAAEGGEFGYPRQLDPPDGDDAQRSLRSTIVRTGSGLRRRSGGAARHVAHP